LRIEGRFMKRILALSMTFALILGIAAVSFAETNTKVKTLNGKVTMLNKAVKKPKHHRHHKHRKHSHHRNSMMKTKMETPTGTTKQNK
jgi:hypothetical protein